MRERDGVQVVNDQVGSPTWARSVADVVFAMVARPRVSGTYHWTDGGQCSWYDFARAIQEEAIDLGRLDKPTAIRPIPASDYPATAVRPAYSVLDCDATTAEFGVVQRPWRENLRLMLKELAT